MSLYASTAAKAILAGGQYLVAQCYDIILASGLAYHFTDCQIPLNNVTVYLPNQTTVGPYNYATGLTISRSTITRKLGVQGGNMKITIAPQADSPNAPVLINGYPILQALRWGFFDNATIRLSRLYMLPPAPGANLDTSPGAIGIFQGQAQDVQAGRLSAEIAIDDYLAILGNQQMPRALYGTSCWHQVYDPGCTLSKSAYTVGGTITSVTDSAHFHTNLTQADDYFDLGVITFTSGVNSGLNQGVGKFLNAGGAIALEFPFPQAPSVGDTFTIWPGCDLQQTTCSSKFSNGAHFGGQPYIPDPATIVDGNAQAPPAQSAGSQAGVIIGGAVTSRTSTAARYTT